MSDADKPMSAKDLRLKISEISKEIDRQQSSVSELESLPVIHKELVGKVRGMARVLAYLEGQLERVRESKAGDAMAEVIRADLKELQEKRNPPPTKEAP
jgi:hypothetical protein